MLPSRQSRRMLAARRARARRRNAGAVIFIVAMTLGLLAVMGVYALAATTQDIRAAGNIQRATQTNYTSNYAAIATADYVNYANADDIVYRRMLNPDPSATSNDRNCLSTQRNDISNTLYGDTRTKSCVRLSGKEMKLPWCGGTPCAPPSGGTPGQVGDREAFTSQSFSHVSNATEGFDGEVYVELTNPTAAAPPAGFDLNSKLKFVMVTATSYGIVKAKGSTAETMRSGRGRFIIGPLKQ